ncbi:MAG: S46 family peptidase [Bacteroidetes bacterium]|nr:S46 family peptidase [Bacteroidota bacterium]
MNRFHFVALTAFAAIFFVSTAQPAFAQDDLGDVQAGRFDNGKMFTLDDPPLDYFREEYGFTPDAEWFEHAQLAALRFATYCSASFASADGLIFTNHHCARQSVTQVSVEEGTDFNEPGFYARSMVEERPIDGLFVEQLISIEDVTDEVNSAAPAAGSDQERRQARRQAISTMEESMGEAAGEDYRVEVVTFYSGGQYKAYTYRRYDNIRLVFAPETQMGYYGGDPDNFTFPRYSLDFSLFRAYDDDGHPLQTENFFQWNPEGTQEGDLVFIIGNPGSTTRLQTVSQLEYRRDINEPAILNALHSRELAYGAFVDNYPDHPATPELTDTYFSLANGRKAYTGRVAGLQDPYIMARRADAEQDFRDALASRADLQAEYGGIMDAIAANREAARSFGPMYGAFVGFRAGSSLSSTVVARSILAYQFLNADDDEAREGIREQMLDMDDQPMELQQALLTARFEDFLEYLGSDSDVTQSSLGSRSPSAAARAIVEGSALTTSEGAAGLLDGGDLSADPGVAMVMAIMPSFTQFQEAYGAANAEMGELSADLARGRFEIFGTSIPPDATFTLRISDGVVKAYEYNGTVAPTHTTFYGLYDHYYSYGPEAENGSWDLPERWLPAPDGLDLSTPYNFVSTNDIIGGNSGSPMLDRDLKVVGIAFDGNIESLPGNYIYMDEFNRTVSVDVRGMLAALEHVYGMERLARELRNGGM